MNPTTFSIETTSTLFLLVPTCFASLFLLVRLVLAFVEQKELRYHARFLFSYLLLVLPRVPKEKQAEFLLLRHTFYSTLLQEKKMYLADIEHIGSFLDLQEDDRVARDAVLFLKSRCIHASK